MQEGAVACGLVSWWAGGLVGGRRALGDKRPRKPTPRPASLRIDSSSGLGFWVA